MGTLFPFPLSFILKMKKELLCTEKYKIEIDLENNRFEVSELEGGQWALKKGFAKYDSAEKYIDDREKRKIEKKLKTDPLICIYAGYGISKQGVKITSIVKKSYGSGFEAWITFPSGSRGKESLEYLYKNTEENKKIFLEIEQLKDKISDLEEKKEKLTLQEVLKHFGEEDLITENGN